MSVPWVNYDASPLLDANEKRKERNRNLLVTAAQMSMGQQQAAAQNLLKQREIDQRAREHAGTYDIALRKLGQEQGYHDEQRTQDAAMAVSKARNMMTPGHPDYNPDGAKALLRAYGFDIQDVGINSANVDPDQPLPPGSM